MSHPRTEPAAHRRACLLTTLGLLLCWTAGPARAQVIILREGTIVIEGGVQGAMTFTIASPDTALETTLPPGEAPDDRLDHLTFLNGDRLQGTLLAIAPTAFGLQWQHAAANTPIAFAPATVNTIQQNTRPHPTPSPHNVHLLLTNGDQLRGTLVSLDGTQALLDTGYAGRIALRRAVIRELRPTPPADRLLYEGPNPDDDWVTPPAATPTAPAWRFEKGNAVAQAATPLVLNLPELPARTSISFSAAWRQFAGFQCAFFTDRPEAHAGNGYMLQFSFNAISLIRRSNQDARRLGGNTTLGQHVLSAQLRQSAGSGHYTLLIDKEQARITLLMDGVFQQTWTDPDGFAGRGNLLLFQPMNTGDLTLSAIRVEVWNGHIPTTDATTTPPNPQEDTVSLVNGDTLTGELQSINVDQVTFKTAFASLDVPLERVQHLTCATARTERARRNKGDIRGLFPNGDRITLNLTALTDGTLQGTSENFGAITLPLAVLASLEFNLYHAPEGGLTTAKTANRGAP